MEITTLVGTFDSNTYIIVGGKGTLIVDCGADIQALTKVLHKSPKPWTLLLTHGHFDHMLNAAQLQRMGAKVYIHELDAERLTTNKNEGERKEFVVENCEVYETLRGDQTLDIAGYNIQVIHTPGHTEGSVCYLIEDKLFAGDTLFFEDYGRTDLYGGDFDKIKKTLYKLFELDPSIVVYSGHYRTTTIAHESKHNPIHTGKN
ncbi:MAG: MBL fold metallo-hydrolase [Clostridiales bacterium]|jgi:glyoxylase-like metal-dependent hydrolase (beta-lactamase superfamily II)|nr:MBL fold metallo-hydrolase [Clostridiales bacterium]